MYIYTLFFLRLSIIKFS